MKKYKKLLCLLLSAVTLLSLTSCDFDVSAIIDTTRSEVEIQKPNGEMQTVDYQNFTLELPADWVKTDAPDGSERLVYVPSADKAQGSSFHFEVAPNDLQTYTLVKFREAMRKSLPQQVAEIYPDAAISEFEYSDFRVSCGNVFVAKYTVTAADGSAVTYTQFYPLIDHYLLLITAEDKGDGVSPPVEEVARYAVSTLTVKE